MKKVVFPALIFFALATILILSPFATNCASSATSVIEFTNDTQEISSKDSTLKISIPWSSELVVKPRPLPTTGGKKDENAFDLINYVKSKADEILTLKNATKVSFKTALAPTMGHEYYPKHSKEFNKLVTFTIHMGEFTKSLNKEASIFIVRGGINSIGKKDIECIKATYNKTTQDLTFTLNPAKSYFDIDGDTYILVAEIEQEKNLPIENPSTVDYFNSSQKTELVNNIGLTEKDITTNNDGKLVLSTSFEEVVKKDIIAKSPNLDSSSLKTLPIIVAEVPKYTIAEIKYDLTGEELKASDIKDLNIFKILASGKVLELETVSYTHLRRRRCDLQCAIAR